MEALKQKIDETLVALKIELPNKETSIQMIIDRTQLYLNRIDVDIRLAGVLVEILKENYEATLKNNSDRVVSISDNGQSISFDKTVAQSLMNYSDQQLFGSHTAILNRFRKVGVIGVNPFKDE